MRAALLALALLLVLPHGAQAQSDGILSFEPPVMDRELRPDLDVGKLLVPVTFVCGTAEAWTGGGVLELESPVADRPGITITGAPAFPISESACKGPASAAWTETVALAVSATQEAPGETDIRVQVGGRVPAQGTAKEQSARVMTTVRVAYLGLVAAQAPSTIAEGAPGSEIGFDVTVENLGNALSTVSFELLGDVPAGWQALPPAPVVLESRQQGGSETARTVRFTVVAPQVEGWNNSEQTFQLKLWPSSTKDPSQRGNEVAINVLARVRGCYPADAACDKALGLPAPVAPLLALGLLGCAVVARRRPQA